MGRFLAPVWVILFSLPGISSAEGDVDGVSARMFERRPFGRDKIFFGRFPSDAFNDRFRRETLQRVDNQIRVFLKRRKFDFPFRIEARQFGIFDDVEMMQFNGVKPERCDAAAREDDVVARFARQAQNEMRSEPEIAQFRALDRVDKAGVVMPAIQKAERRVVRRLEPNFQREPFFFRDIREEIENAVS